MPAIGVTGSLGSGKSAVSALLAEALACRTFDADACVHDLLARDPDVISAIRQHFGETVFEHGLLDRGRLRAQVFAQEDDRRWLEALLHPRVREAWKALATEAKGEPLIVEIPLLFETGAQESLDLTVTVECSPEVRRSRLITRRGLTPQEIEKILAAQWPPAKKIEAADFVIWNDGSLSGLQRQTRVLANVLLTNHG